MQTFALNCSWGNNIVTIEIIELSDLFKYNHITFLSIYCTLN